jgi:hypothetical protein
MSIKTEQRTETRTDTYEATVERHCDLCGLNAAQPRNDEYAPWRNSHFDQDRVLVQHEYGTRYPEATDIITDAFDVCPDCWRNKVVPWFAQHGATPHQSKLSY